MQARAVVVFILVALSATLSCNTEKEKTAYRVIGEAFAGPNQLPLRQELSLRSPVVGTVAHAEKLEVLDRRRRFVQVRTKGGLIGWVDIRLLISGKQMEVLDQLAEKFKSAPTMAKVTVFDILNVHTDANRYSPTFLQIPEKAHFDLIGHKVVLRTPYQGDSLDLDDDAPEPASKKKRARKEPKISLPAAPPAPKLPENWLELSKSPAPPPGAAGPGAKDKPAEAKPMDDMSLVRTSDGRVGWVLSNALFLDVPDDVAQYAEGHRITSYFSLGEVLDGDTKKNHWLWTTQSQKYAPFEFDGLRLFYFNTRRHRYETAYRERGIKGFYPTLVDRTKPVPEFRIVVEDETGALWQKAYSFDGNRVKILGKQPYAPPKDLQVSSRTVQPADQGAPGLFERLKKMLPGRD